MKEQVRAWEMAFITHTQLARVCVQADEEGSKEEKNRPRSSSTKCVYTWKVSKHQHAQPPWLSEKYRPWAGHNATKSGQKSVPPPSPLQYKAHGKMALPMGAEGSCLLGCKDGAWECMDGSFHRSMRHHSKGRQRSKPLQQQVNTLFPRLNVTVLQGSQPVLLLP